MPHFLTSKRILWCGASAVGIKHAGDLFLVFLFKPHCFGGLVGSFIVGEDIWVMAFAVHSL